MSNLDQATQISSETCKRIIYWAIGCGGWIGLAFIPNLWKRSDMTIVRFFLSFTAIPICASLSALVVGLMYIGAVIATIVGRIMLNPAFIIPGISVVSIAILGFLIGTVNNIISLSIEFEEYHRKTAGFCKESEDGNGYESDEVEESQAESEEVEESQAESEEVEESQAESEEVEESQAESEEVEESQAESEEANQSDKSQEISVKAEEIHEDNKSDASQKNCEETDTSTNDSEQQDSYVVPESEITNVIEHDKE
jgi:hypothetical protein